MIYYSFIIPVYNCIDYLSACVDSILRAIALQSFDAEIVLIDDGSTDGSSMLCDQLSKKDKYIRIIHQNNQGVSCARNRGIQEAKGEFIVFVDADDEIIPESMARLMDNFPSTIDMAIYGLLYNYYSNDKLLTTTYLSPSLQGVKKRGEWECRLLDLYQSNALTSVWSRIIRRDLLLENDIFFKTEMFSFEDLDFVLRTMSYCNTVYFTSELIYKYQVRTDDDKYQQRMDRIAHISDVTNEIENSLHTIKNDIETDSILLRVYALLLKDKQVNKDKDFKLGLYKEFKAWVDSHNLYYLVKDSRDLLLAYSLSYYRILVRNKYYSVKHQIAVKLKRKIGYIGNRL